MSFGYRKTPHTDGRRSLRSTVSLQFGAKMFAIKQSISPDQIFRLL
jgi:hypothetical protein